MMIKRTVVVGVAVSLFANASFAAGVRMFKFDETPDPKEVASVLSSSPPPGLKMRSIRLLQTSSEAATPDTGKATDSSATDKSERPEAPPQVAVAPTATMSDAAPAAAPITATKSVAGTGSKSADTPSSLGLPVQFAFDSAQILPAAYRQLDAFAAGIKLAGAGVRVVIEGHTDSIGSDEYNLRLSSQRAESVRTYLITHHGIDPAQLRVVGMGKLAPLNKSVPTAPENRRVEFRAEA